jgi:hypothetical protein
MRRNQRSIYVGVVAFTLMSLAVALFFFETLSECGSGDFRVASGVLVLGALLFVVALLLREPPSGADDFKRLYF